jgi:hypothetical protein
MTPPLKTISYRGGLVTFRVPERWKEQYESDGGAEFFDDVAGSPTLRLNVISAHRPGVTLDTAAETLLDYCKSPTQIEQLEPGAALTRFSEEDVERGERLIITYWLVAQAVPPEQVRIANFSWSILERHKNHVAFSRDFQLIESEIRTARIFKDTV